MCFYYDFDILAVQAKVMEINMQANYDKKKRLSRSKRRNTYHQRGTLHTRPPVRSHHIYGESMMSLSQYRWGYMTLPLQHILVKIDK